MSFVILNMTIDIVGTAVDTSAPTGPRPDHGRRVLLPTGSGPDLLGWWHAAGTVPHARGVAVVAPGVAVPSRVMAPLAETAAGRGWDVLRIEFPGVGASPVAPQHVPGGMQHWGSRDLDAALRAAAERAGDRPVVLVGHSAGAWLVGLTPMAARVDGVLAIASMSGAWRSLKRTSWPLLLPAMYGVIPVITRLTGRLPGWTGLGEDAPGGAMQQWARWCRRPGFVFDDPAVPLHLDLLDAPVRVLLPADDAWATPAAVDGFWGRAGATSYELVVIDPADHGEEPIGHVGLLRNRFVDLWQQQIEWLEQVTGRPRRVHSDRPTADGTGPTPEGRR